METNVLPVRAWAGTNESICPHLGMFDETCRASLTRFPVSGSTKNRYCSNEDFDSCPMFLSKLIRRAD